MIDEKKYCYGELERGGGECYIGLKHFNSLE